ncbi:MAG: energy-coupling factor ABC transporter substrate-binding protein [Veillonellaceae bacterium]|jgi:cobalt/nickel transport protein|nr:energy-coupling factor ABC transporter substrate-binding protein [Veillonellaceae bacterium]
MVSKQNIILLVLVVLLAVVPLMMHKESEFGGTDDQAQSAIEAINPDYEPWVNALWEPPSGEVESLLFALQAAIGAGFIGYFVGYQRGRKAPKPEEKGIKATATATTTN